MMDSLKGFLLVASPHLADPNFYRSVVLIVDHSDEGALGLILNRVSNTPLSQVWQSIETSTCNSDQHLHVGGPVSGPLMCLHASDDLDGEEVLPNVYFSSEKETLESLVEEPDQPFRIFSGYSGWGAGQLETEMQAGGWLSAPARWEDVFAEEDDDGLWQRVTHAIGADITDRALKIRHAPADPRCN